MQGITKDIQNEVQKALAEKKVDLVIGFSKGSLPLHSTPVFIRKPEDAEKLVWDYTCENNLANYLRKKKDQRVGVVVKGCDSRSIVALLKENQIIRDNLYIIGVPCTGMIDRKQVASILDGKELLEVEYDGDSVELKGKNFSENVKIADVMHRTCVTCMHRNPVMYDVMIGEAVPEQDGGFADVEAFEAKTTEERRSYIAQELSKCIRCYACRNACPMCYCEECFVDCSNPQWIGKSAGNIQDNILFQVVRVFHGAGRCTDCGACDRACPMDIDLRILNRKLVKDAKLFFNAEAGINVDDAPALDVFDMDDPQPFLGKE